MASAPRFWATASWLKLRNAGLWPTVAMFAAFLLYAGVLAIPSGPLYVAILLAVAWQAAAFISVVLLTIGILLGWWRLVAQWLVACLGLGMLVCAPTPSTSAAGFAASIVRVAAYSSDLQRLFAASAQAGTSPPIAVITLDGLGSMADGLAYDPSGQMALPESQKSPAWKASASNTELGVASTEVRHIFGSYYAWFH